MAGREGMDRTNGWLIVSARDAPMVAVGSDKRGDQPRDLKDARLLRTGISGIDSALDSH